MLVFSAIVPHPPILIPRIGKDNLEKLQKTVHAFDILEKELNEAKPDTIIVISPHGDINFDAFTVNINEKYIATYEDFGDFSTKKEYRSDLGFVNTLKGGCESSLPLQLISNQKLDHGASIPLFYLTRQNSDRRILPITFSYLNFQKHLDFGVLLKEAVFNSEKRYAIIASGDLSHKLTMKAPAGFSPRAKEFDKKLIQLLKKGGHECVSGILNLEPKFIEEAGECGLRSILILLGVIKNMSYDFEVLSYESPFGVGYLVGQIKFK